MLPQDVFADYSPIVFFIRFHVQTFRWIPIAGAIRQKIRNFTKLPPQTDYEKSGFYSGKVMVISLALLYGMKHYSQTEKMPAGFLK
jgi:hypothetical protein